jgi:hypothetical protein
MAVIREQLRVSLPSDSELASQPIETPYAPTTFGRRLWCTCRDIPLRIAFISFIKRLRSKAKKARLRWLQGDRRRSFPAGLFPPSQPVLTNVLPAYERCASPILYALHLSLSYRLFSIRFGRNTFRIMSPKLHIVSSLF